MENGMNIYETISAVMKDVGSIKKEKMNTTQRFLYRGVDDVMNALNPAFVKYHLFIVPEVIEQTREERRSTKGVNLIYSICKMKYTFYAPDGSSVSAVVIGEGMDSGDKATNKAMSVAFKYACFQVFCIPTEEMKDPDSESNEVMGQYEKPAQGARNQQHGDTQTERGENPVRATAAQINTIKGLCEKHNINYPTLLAMKGVEEKTMTGPQAGMILAYIKKNIRDE